MSDEAIKLALTVKLEALRELGAVLKAQPKAKGAICRGAQLAPRGNDAPTYAGPGLTKKEAAFAQKLAELPEMAFERRSHGTTAFGWSCLSWRPGRWAALDWLQTFEFGA